MRARIRRFHSPDAEWDTYAPDDATDFGLLLQILVGPDDDEGEESFDIMVATPAWLARELESRPVLSGRHHLFVRSFDRPAIEAYLRRAVAGATGTTWTEITDRLARLGRYEFEDYDG